MSLPATLFSAYLVVGLLLMVVAMASGEKRKRAATLDPLIDGTEMGAGVLVFIALLWPIWLIMWLTKKEDAGQQARQERKSK